LNYHAWTEVLGDVLPEPERVETVYPSTCFDREIPVGIGIHDSSSSLVPYFTESDEPFILASTGTWCINMNPFNHAPLTPGQLQNDCLAYLSVQQKPVKSSRLFMGHIHDVNVQYLAEAFKVDKKAYLNIALNTGLVAEQQKKQGNDRIFFKDGIPENYFDTEVDPSRFGSFEEAYHQLMSDLTKLAVEAIERIAGENDGTRNLYITGGFSKNPVFVALLASHYPDKKVYTSEIPNATSLGAALTLWKALEENAAFDVDLGLKQIQRNVNEG
jgi:sugar (pentulose or hexulose) kinase